MTCPTPLDSLTAVADLVGARTGLRCEGARFYALRSAVDGLRQGDTLEAYADRLRNDDAVLDELLEQVTVRETYFFREPKQLDFVRTTVVPEILRTRPSGPIRLWSAGCSSGEEPYSLAIMMTDLGLAARTRIIGTDLSRTALRTARDAVYRHWSLRATPPDALRRHFRRRGDCFEVEPQVRGLVEVKHHNLAEDHDPWLSSGPEGLDVVLCRNVFIYLDAETIRSVALRLARSLRRGGWLLLGASDPLLPDVPGLTGVMTEAGMAYRRGAADRGRSDGGVRPTDRRVRAHESPRRRPASRAVSPPSRNGARRSLTTSAGRVSDPSSALELALERYQAGRRDDAAAVLARFDRRSPELWTALVHALADRGDLEGAGHALDVALQEAPHVAELRLLHALILAEAGRLAEAIWTTRLALYLDRRSVLAHMTLGSLHARRGERSEAVRAYANAARLLAAARPEAPVPGFGGACAGALAPQVAAHLELLGTRAEVLR